MLVARVAPLRATPGGRMRRTLSWPGVCALSDIVPAVASRGFATPGAWLAPPTIGLLIAVPVATFVVGWWLCLMDG